MAQETVKQYTIIRRALGDIQFKTYVNVNSFVRFELMKEHYIQLNFSTKEKIYFSIGDYCETEYGVFEITKNYVPTYNKATAGYDYQLRMDAQYWKWNNKLLLFQPLTKRFETSWSLTDTIDKHLAILQQNLKYHGFKYNGSDFSFNIDANLLGTAKLVVYESTHIIDALNTICEEFECEWWVIGSVINVGRCEQGTAVNFKLEENVKQMTGATGEGTHATRIYPFGSTKNVPKNYRSEGDSLVLNGVIQRRVMLPEKYGKPYIQLGEIDVEEEAIEAVAIFDEVYPHTDGTMTTVTHDERDIDDGEGGTEKVKIYRFKDADFTFREKYILAGQDLQIVIQSGVLKGMTFDVKFNPDNKAEEIDGEINPEAQVFEIVRNDTYGPMLPNDELNPEMDAGVKYRLIGWDTTYMQELGLLDAAERELQTEAEKYVEKLQMDDSTYTCTMMSDYMYGLSGDVLDKMQAKSFDIGQRVTLINDNFFKGGSRESRIIGYQYKLDFKYDEAQYIVGETLKYSRLNDIESRIDAISYKSDVQLYEAGSGVYVIKTTDTTPASEYNVFSAKRSLSQFLRKDVDDTAAGRIDFRGRTKHYDGVQFGQNFAGGITGFGGFIDGAGRGEMRSLTLWEWLQVPELRYNRISIQVGNRWRAPGGGIILSVDPDLNSDGTPANTGTIELYLEEGEIGKVAVDDICMGIYHDGMTLSNNDADDFDDSKGNFRFSGFFTVYFAITRILETGKNSRFKYVLRNDANWHTGMHPCAMMHFVAYGNFTDTERQSSRYSTLTYERYLTKVNTWEYSVRNIGAQFGDLSNLSVYGLDMEGYSAYLNNIYMSGHLVEVDDIVDEVSQYNVDFSDYVDVITVDDVGNVIGGLYKIDTNNVKYDYRIHSAIQVRRNSQLLIWAEDGEDAAEGTYKIHAEAVGCTCVIKNSTIYITAIEHCKDGVAGTSDDTNFDYDAMRNVDSCFVNLVIDCEGKTTLVKKFPVTIKHDAQPYVGADIDNEASAVSWNTKQQRYIGLPITMRMKMWHNNELLDIASVNDISVTNTVGATISKSIETVVVNEGKEDEYSYKQAKVQITALPANAPLVSNFEITCVATYAGVRYERTKVHTLNKSTDTNVYSLLPSVDAVSVNKNNNVPKTISTDKITCQVVCDSSEDKHFIVPVASYNTHKVAIYYQIFYNNGTSGSETPYDASGTGVQVSEAMSEVRFVLYGIGSDGNVDKTIIHDKESVPVIAEGVDGKGVEYIFWLQDSWSGDSGDGTGLATPQIQDDSSTAAFQEDSHCPKGRNSDSQSWYDGWTDEPTGVGINNKYEFYAQRKKINGVWQPFGDVHLWNKHTVDGTSPYMLDLSNDQSFINCNNDGKVIGTYETTTIMLFMGGKDAFSMFNIAITPYNISYNISTDGKTITPYGITSVNASIDIRATLKTNSSIVLTAVYKINKSMKGADGIIYSLVPSLNVIHKDGKGNFIDTQIAISVKKTVGDSTTLLTTYAEIAAENLTLKYLQGAGTTENSFPSNSNTIGTSAAVGQTLYTVILLKSGSNVIDRERINCVQDGDTTPVYIIEAGPKSVTIPRDSSSAVYAGNINFYKAEGDTINPVSLYSALYVRKKDGTRRFIAGKYTFEGYSDLNFYVYDDDEVIECFCNDEENGNSLLTDYVAKEELPIYKEGNTGPQGEDADFHEVIARGTHYSSSVYPEIRVDGQEIYLSYSRGLTLTVLRADLTMYSQQTYDVYADYSNGNTTNTDQLITAITNQATADRILILTSYDAIYIHDRLWAKLACEFGVGVDIRTTGKRRAIAIIAQKGMKPGQALVSWTELEDYARVRTSVASGVVCVFGKDEVPVGENLLRQTDFKLLSAWSKHAGTVVEYDYEGCNAYLITQPSSSYVDKLEQVITETNSGILKNSTWYTLSFYARGGTIRTHIYPSLIDTSEKCYIDGVAATPAGDGQLDWAKDEVYRLHTYTFKTKAAYSSTQKFSAQGKLLWRKYADTDGNVYICMPKLEEGCYATKWQTKEEDRKGLNGCHERLFEQFTPYMTYYNEENDIKEGIRYVDFLAVEDNSYASGYKVYMCLDTHQAAATLAQDLSHWTEVSINAASAFFTFLIAKNANIKMLTSAQFTIAEENGTVVAGLANTDYPLWVGGSVPSSAPFRVTRDGKLYATGAVINGRIEATHITADVGTIAGFTLSGNGLTHIVSDSDISSSYNMGYIICRNDYHSRFAGIGANVLPASTGASAVARFENNDDTETWFGTNIAAIVSAKNAFTDNIALSILGGNVQGFALKTQIIGLDTISQSTEPTNSDKSVTIARTVGVVYASTQWYWNNTSKSPAEKNTRTRNLNITLPTMRHEDDGHMVWIKRGSNDNSTLRIYSGGSYHKEYNSSTGKYEDKYYTTYLITENDIEETYNTKFDKEGYAALYVYFRDLTVTMNNVTYKGAWVEFRNPRYW